MPTVTAPDDRETCPVPVPEDSNTLAPMSLAVCDVPDIFPISTLPLPSIDKVLKLLGNDCVNEYPVLSLLVPVITMAPISYSRAHRRIPV